MPKETIQSIVSVIVLVVIFLTGLYLFAEYRQGQYKSAGDPNFIGPTGQPFTEGPDSAPPGSIQ